MVWAVACSVIPVALIQLTMQIQYYSSNDLGFWPAHHLLFIPLDPLISLFSYVLWSLNLLYLYLYLFFARGEDRYRISLYWMRLL